MAGGVLDFFMGFAVVLFEDLTIFLHIRLAHCESGSRMSFTYLQGHLRG